MALLIRLVRQFIGALPGLYTLCLSGGSHYTRFWQFGQPDSEALPCAEKNVIA
jgi:hypothetical protein